MQQTRVDQGRPYYLRLLKRYPEVRDLAAADQSQVLREWEGLGYYSRARNMHAAARQVMDEFGGRFPDQYDQLLQLKGVGPYTAAAVSSMAGGEVRAVVDGNVYRVLARHFGVETPVNTPAGQREFQHLADTLLYRPDPGRYNQALMEFGALQCVPRQPDCSRCPLQNTCEARAAGKVNALPVKQRKQYNRHRYFHYFLLHQQGRLFLQKRGSGDIWQGLHEFFLVEGGKVEDTETLEALLAEALPGSKFQLQTVTDLPVHKLSHQTIHAQVAAVEVHFAGLSEGRWITPDELEKYALPRPLRQFLEAKQLTLPLR